MNGDTDHRAAPVGAVVTDQDDLTRQVVVLRSLLDQEREQRRRELVRGAEELDRLREQRKTDAATIRRLKAVERRHVAAGLTTRARLRRALRRRAPQGVVRLVRTARGVLR